jgi:hypothetical protein
MKRDIFLPAQGIAACSAAPILPVLSVPIVCGTHQISILFIFFFDAEIERWILYPCHKLCLWLLFCILANYFFKDTTCVSTK